ncbi:hypothetical protein AJ80_03745 [Polytolypa hystricis UAMH7299]|uniref:Uncharacterized protein n=1 Tax=Polytolypa hystricis (strain UAMH7299) TaxID=1447883 RepID=A0A2B7YFY8_POLH7|nr:hypothetical protein AJ80_03745 [Polytolypa hystricis UAMH7299]
MSRAARGGRKGGRGGKAAVTGARAGGNSGKNGSAARGRPKRNLRLEEDTEEVSNDGVGDANDMDDDEDEGSDGETQMETQATKKALKELENAMARAEKKDNFAKEFEKEVHEDEKRLLGILETQRKERFGNPLSTLPLSEICVYGMILRCPKLIYLIYIFASRDSEIRKFETQFSAFLAAALTPTGEKSPAQDGEAEISGDPSPTNQPLYLKYQTLLASTKSLVKEYDGLIKHYSAVQRPQDPTPQWEKDCAEVRRVISVGREASEKEIERLLAYKRQRKGKTALRERKRIKAFEKDQHLQAMLKMGLLESEGGKWTRQKTYGWGRAARKMEKGMKALVKALPEN